MLPVYLSRNRKKTMSAIGCLLCRLTSSFSSKARLDAGNLLDAVVVVVVVFQLSRFIQYSPRDSEVAFGLFDFNEDDRPRL
jgi:hypothetical protein